jgi:hypothetical protein
MGVLLTLLLSSHSKSIDLSADISLCPLSPLRFNQKYSLGGKGVGFYYIN